MKVGSNLPANGNFVAGRDSMSHTWLQIFLVLFVLQEMLISGTIKETRHIASHDGPKTDGKKTENASHNGPKIDGKKTKKTSKYRIFEDFSGVDDDIG